MRYWLGDAQKISLIYSVYIQYSVIQLFIYIYIFLDRETERQRDRVTERQRDREKKRQRDRETEKKLKEHFH